MAYKMKGSSFYGKDPLKGDKKENSPIDNMKTGSYSQSFENSPTDYSESPINDNGNGDSDVSDVAKNAANEGATEAASEWASHYPTKSSSTTSQKEKEKRKKRRAKRRARWKTSKFNPKNIIKTIKKVVKKKKTK